MTGLETVHRRVAISSLYVDNLLKFQDFDDFGQSKLHMVITDENKNETEFYCCEQ